MTYELAQLKQTGNGMEEGDDGSPADVEPVGRKEN